MKMWILILITLHDDYLIENWKPASLNLGTNNTAEFRFESPISISKLNNYSDFGRKSENYSKVKVFSDSRPKSAQKLILKVFSDFPTQIICRLSKILNFLIWWYTRARMAFMVACLLWDKKTFDWVNQPFAVLFMDEFLVSGRWEHRSCVPVLVD